MSIVASVRFRNGSKSYYFDPRDLKIEGMQDAGYYMETTETMLDGIGK